MYTISQARAVDLLPLADIELAAARLLTGHAPESVLTTTTSIDSLTKAQRDGRLWVARAGDSPVGFAYVEVLEADSPHLEELDVHPDHGRRGLGTRLVNAVCEWAGNEGYAAVTLSTFRDVPWNMPFYARLGFELVTPEDQTAALKAIVAAEKVKGLSVERRVVMRRVVDAELLQRRG